eukprot:gene11152-1615_t
MALCTPFHLLPLNLIESPEFNNQLRPAGMRQPGERTMAFDAVLVRGFVWMYVMLDPEAVHDYVQIDKWAEAERLGVTHPRRRKAAVYIAVTQPHPRAGIAPVTRAGSRAMAHARDGSTRTHFSASLLYKAPGPRIAFDRTPPPYKRDVGGGGAAAFWWCGMVPRELFYVIREFWRPVQHEVIRIDGTLDHADL